MLNANFLTGSSLLMSTQGFGLRRLHVTNAGFTRGKQQVPDFFARGREAINGNR